VNQINEELIPWSLPFLNAEFSTKAVFRNLLLLLVPGSLWIIRRLIHFRVIPLLYIVETIVITSLSLNTVIKMLVLLLLLAR